MNADAYNRSRQKAPSRTVGHGTGPQLFEDISMPPQQQQAYQMQFYPSGD